MTSYFVSPPQETLLQRMLRWISGAPKDNNFLCADKQVEDTCEPRLKSQQDQQDPPSIGMHVGRDPRPALVAFQDAITDATRLFCAQHVHPIWKLDQRTRFRVTGIQIYVPADKPQFMSVLESLPIDVRNRMARVLVKGSPGAAEQLVVDDGFFGITLNVEQAHLPSGQVVRVLATWSEGSSELRLVYSGTYIDVEPEASFVEPPPKHSTAAEATNGLQKASETARPAMSPHHEITSHLEMARSPTAPLKNPEAGATPMHPPAKTVQNNGSTDTPLSSAVHTTEVARLRYQYAGQAQEHILSLSAEMLPFMIGREHRHSGRCANGLSLARPEDPDCALLVSREHLEIQRYDPEGKHLYIVNHGAHRNGSFDRGCALSERFVLGGTQPRTFQLGGNAGAEGTVTLTIELL